MMALSREYDMETLPPEALVRLCQQTLPEDTRAFEALVAQFKGRVYATVLSGY